MHPTAIPLPLRGAVVFPLALLDEGHTGVALFMVLSGYLFAKLLDGKRLHCGWFLWNRIIRLLPLLLVVLGVVAVSKWWSGESLIYFWKRIARGWLHPSLPNGGSGGSCEVIFGVSVARCKV